MDENWWQGQIDHNFGIFPLTHVTELGHSARTVSASHKQQQAVVNSSVKSQTMLQVPVNDQPSSANNEASIQISNNGLGIGYHGDKHDSVIARAKAHSDLSAQLDEELTFKAGDIIEITKVLDSDFAIGRCADGRTGQFPLGFVQVFEGSVNLLPSSQPTEQPRSKFDWWKDPAAAVQHVNKQSTADSSDVISSRPSFEEQTAPITPIMIEEYALNTSHRFYTSQSTADDEAFQTSLPNAFPGGCFARALFQFVAENDNELSLLPGDIVHVIGPADDQWIEGEMGNKRGIFPMTFVEICDYDSASAVHAMTNDASDIGNASTDSLHGHAQENYSKQGHESAYDSNDTFADHGTADSSVNCDETFENQPTILRAMAPASDDRQSPCGNVCDVECADSKSQPTTDTQPVGSLEHDSTNKEELGLYVCDQSSVSGAADSPKAEVKERAGETIENLSDTAGVGVSVSKPSPSREKPAVSPKKVTLSVVKPEMNRPKPQLKPKPASAQHPSLESKLGDAKLLSDSKPALTVQPATTKRPAVPKKSTEIREVKFDLKEGAAAFTASRFDGSQGSPTEVVRTDLKNENATSSAAVHASSETLPQARGDVGLGGIVGIIPAQVPVPAARSDARYQNSSMEQRPPRSVSFDDGIKTYIIDDVLNDASQSEGRQCGNSTFYADLGTIDSSWDTFSTGSVNAAAGPAVAGRINSRSSPVPPKRPNAPARSVTVDASAPRGILKPQQPNLIPCRPAPPRPAATPLKGMISMCLGHGSEAGN